MVIQINTYIEIIVLHSILLSEFSLPDDGVGKKKVIIFGVAMSSSVDYHNKKKSISILGKGPTQGLDDTTLKAEAQYSINFSRPNRKCYLTVGYNGSDSFFIW